LKIEEYIREQALGLGFGAVGFARLEPSRSSEVFQQWLSKGYGAEMHYLKRHAALRSDPRNLAPSAKSIIVVAARYPSENIQYPISNFARGADYHHVLKIKLAKLAEALAGKCGGEKTSNIGRIYVDSDPLSEREWAVRAGIGWIGRQGSVVNPELGCCFFLGELLVNIELEPSQQLPPQCQDCRLCEKACPTGAIMPGNLVDARRCISYLTIEHKGDINPEIASCFGSSVFGCDRCTSVCPWNQCKKMPIMPEFDISPPAVSSLENLSALDKIGFQKMFRNTPVARIGLERLLRNVRIALDNKKSESRSQPACNAMRSIAGR